jgi:hypothetical protein
MGFRGIPRADYTALCDANGRGPHRVGRWAPEGDLATVSEWRPAQA